MKVFFGKINKDVNIGQLDEGYYISPKESSKYGSGSMKIDVGDYCFMIGGGKIALWKAKKWKKDRLEFDILKENIFKNTSWLAAFRFFRLDIYLLVFTKRQSIVAFCPIQLVKGFSETSLLDDKIYQDENNYRKLKLLLKQDDIEPISIDVQLYFVDKELKLFSSPFLDNEITSQYRDNSGHFGEGRKQKDRTIKKLQKENAPIDFNADRLSLGSFYDAYCVEYDKGNPDPPEKQIKYWAGGFDGKKSYDRLNNFKSNNYWQAMDYEDSDQSSVAKEARKLFTQIEVGDKFIIKGLGGKNDLIVHYAGTVINKNTKSYRLDFERLSIALYKGKAPRGKGAGNWHNTLLEIKRKKDIELLFKEARNPLSSDDLPKNPNIILYGPPGTGKTYNTVELAYNIINGYKAKNHEDAQVFFKQERGNRIEFITFHQNYAYEDFVQGIRPKLFDEQLKFGLKDGIFSKICYNAMFEFYTGHLIKKDKPDQELEFEELYNLFIDYLREQDLKSIELESKEKKPIHIKSINEKGNIQITHGNKIKPYLVSKKRLKKLWEYYDGDITKIKTINDDIKNAIKGCNATAYWTIFNELFKFKNNYTSPDDDTDELEDFSELDFKQKKELIKSVGFNSLSGTAKDSDADKYVLIIDEINRANISRVFGELITLIEKDKRLGGDNEIRVSLPNGEEFAIPPNLYIIGTMNTADKSIALVDIALRRRFEFRKKYPLYKIEGHEIFHTEQLRNMNNKIRELKGADFQIGHSYFMGDDFNLTYTMNNKVIPLLYEYFMNDSDSVKKVLEKGKFNIKDETETDSGLIEFIEDIKKDSDMDKKKD